MTEEETKAEITKITRAIVEAARKIVQAEGRAVTVDGVGGFSVLIGGAQHLVSADEMGVHVEIHRSHVPVHVQTWRVGDILAATKADLEPGVTAIGTEVAAYVLRGTVP